MGNMRYIPLALLMAAIGCESSQPEVLPEGKLPDPEIIADAIDTGENPAYELVKRTHTNVRHYNELRRQGQTTQMVAVHRAIGRTVDDNWDTYRKLVLDKKTPMTPRNWALAGVGFALSKRAAARELLESVLQGEEEAWIVANTCLSLSVLADRDTNLSLIIPLLSHSNIEVRTSAATCIKEVWRVSETPRKLTPQLYAAIDALVALSNDRTSTRARTAAVWALANLRHPGTLDYLVAALGDDQEMVQVGGLYGIWVLGDARALDPLFDFLDDSPSPEAASWAKKALSSIAVQNGFAKTPSELDELGTSGRSWRKWFRGQRSK